MALLTDATVIVEAGQNSGARLQGWEALRLGRLLFLLESVATDPTLSWPKDLIRHGRPDPVTREPGDCMGEPARIHSIEHLLSEA